MRAAAAFLTLWTGLTPLPVAVVVTAAYGVYALWRLSVTGGDPSFFIVAGPPSSDPHSTLPNVFVFPPGTTYDGQFFYRLALELGRRLRAEVVELGLLGLLVAALAAVATTYRRRLLETTSVLPLACMLYAILALLYAGYIWQDDHSYLRALHELYLTAGLALLAASVWFTRVLGAATVVVWLAFALQSAAAL
jgi:hypothetical protein